MTPLNLTGADTTGADFTPIRPGSYPATVFEATWTELQGGPGKVLPKGTPVLNLQFKVDTEQAVDIEGKELNGSDRRVFSRYNIAPEKIGNKPYEHKAKMDGMLVRMLEAVGYDKSEVMVEDFEIDLDDLGGRECTVILAVEEYTPNDPDFDDNDEPIKKKRNVVKGVKKAGAGRGAVGKVGGII